MKVFITEEFLISSIQNEFSAIYPHLKLKFYVNPHGIYEGSAKNEELAPSTPIDEIRNIHTAAWIDMGKNQTAAGLESEFARLLGLNAQVFRKSGNVWLETTATDGRTLGELEASAAGSQFVTALPETDQNDMS
ncbi:hypothetical protein [Chitinophaga cymbidii]|uniref:Uncharacterized protein n=1 Tax=Chitinophaga cymbidii TaxID=1096750 RepID=A0A512RMV6_9BACT|nr:hypothetical protein [Chitinophaga cymbidii]GEP97020.1 hypothetical protein CCY01nite_32800 [Chitinophaga cymbidii]